MRKKIFNVLFASIIAISLLLVTAPSVLAKGVNIAEIEGLSLTINDNPNDNQVFLVGETLDIEGHVSGFAHIGWPNADDFEAEVSWELRITHGSTSTYLDEGSDYSSGEYGAYVDLDEDFSSTYSLTDQGSYTLILIANAVTLQGGEIQDVDDDIIVLNFSAVPKVADLITDGGDNPTDIGDLFVNYADGEYNVLFHLEPPWKIVDTQVYIGTDVPTKSSPGQFPYSAGAINEDSSPPPPAPPVYIAAHAQIKMQIDKPGKPKYTYAGVWAQAGSGNDFTIGNGANWATCFLYPAPSITAAITNVNHYSPYTYGNPYPGVPGNEISISWQWSNMVGADHYTWELYNTTFGDGAEWIVASGGSSVLPATLTYSTTAWEGYAPADDTYMLIVKLYWINIPSPFATVTDNWPHVSP